MDKRLHPFNGDSLLATPAPDPEETSKENMEMWKKMNKVQMNKTRVDEIPTDLEV